MNIGKMIVLTFTDSEETAFQRAVSLLTDEFGVETVQPVSSAVLSFYGLEIRRHQRRVLRDRRDVRLTRIGPDCKNPTYLKTVLGRRWVQVQC